MLNCFVDNNTNVKCQINIINSFTRVDKFSFQINFLSQNISYKII